jgi:DNA-binding NarL/FixJ family response regulator
MLEASDAVDVVASCECAEDALHAVAETHADVVLTDIRMPPTHTDEGIALARSLRERHPDVGVVVLSQHVSPEYAIGLLQEGSVGRGYLLKDRLHDIDALESALVSVAGGGCQIDPLVVQALTSARTRPASPLEALTPRELEILGDIAEGANNQAIADRRVLTRRAVEKHASSIFMKLGLADDPDANRRVRSVLVYLRDAA